MSSTLDLEKTVVGEPQGLHSDQTRDNASNRNDRIDTPMSATRALGSGTSEADALARFRHYVGIHNDSSLITSRIAPNAGIYPRVIQAEKRHRREYTIFAWLINGALGLQIVFAAALTALGAGNGPRSAVTAFGAMNTIIAGFLTFLKGSGLPNRLKYYENEMGKVREYIEQREREFTRGELHEDALREEIVLIEEMYENVRRDIEANKPDNYVSLTRASAMGANSDAQQRLSRQMNGVKSRFDEMRHGWEDRRRDLEHGYQQTRSGLENAYTSNRGDLERGYNLAKTDAEKSYQGARHDFERKIDDTKYGLEDQIRGARRGVESDVKNARYGLESDIHGLDNRIQVERQEMEHRIAEEKKAHDARMSGMEVKVQETEEKALAMAEKIAEKVLAATQKKRGEGHE